MDRRQPAGGNILHSCTSTDNMKEDLSSLDILIRKEADEILYDKGLFNLLNQYGIPHITGSYDLELMTWRDLDIYLENNTIPEAEFFELGKKLCALFQPVKMSYRNERKAETHGLPKGLYWGIYLGDERSGAWKIDIWTMKSPELQQRIKFCTDIKGRLTEETRKAIMEIKSECWKNPGYRRSFLSTDIYRAVLDHGIGGMTDFQNYLRDFVLDRT
jgi:hypothetical protein